jgi:predicted ester cyclase
MRRACLFHQVGLTVLTCMVSLTSLAYAQNGRGARNRGTEGNKLLVRRWIEEGFNKRSLAVVDELFVERFVVNGQGVGRDGLKQSMSRHLTGFPDLHVTIDEIVAEKNRVGIWYTVEGTHGGEFEGISPTHRQVKWSGCDLMTVEGGRITEARFLSDSLGLLRQLGATPSAPRAQP